MESLGHLQEVFRNLEHILNGALKKSWRRCKGLHGLYRSSVWDMGKRILIIRWFCFPLKICVFDVGGSDPHLVRCAP